MCRLVQLSNTHQPQRGRGFSLIEVLVSLALFAIVVSVSVSTLIVLIDANSRAQETREVMTQVSSVLDAMTREIRTGYNYRCNSDLELDDNAADPADCSDGLDQFAFTESGGSLTSAVGSSNRIGYRLHNGKIQRNLGGPGGISWQDVTPDNVTITTLKFTTTGAERTSASDYDSPLVTIIIEGSVQSFNGSVETFALQTSVTQRLLDL